MKSPGGEASRWKDHPGPVFRWERIGYVSGTHRRAGGWSPGPRVSGPRTTPGPRVSRSGGGLGLMASGVPATTQTLSFTLRNGDPTERFYKVRD